MSQSDLEVQNECARCGETKVKDSLMRQSPTQSLSAAKPSEASKVWSNHLISKSENHLIFLSSLLEDFHTSRQQNLMLKESANESTVGNISLH